MKYQTLIKEICPTTTQTWAQKGFSTKGDSTAINAEAFCYTSSGCC